LFVLSSWSCRTLSKNWERGAFGVSRKGPLGSYSVE
jgi:hypothetical protein